MSKKKVTIVRKRRSHVLEPNLLTKPRKICYGTTGLKCAQARTLKTFEPTRRLLARLLRKKVEYL